MAAAPPPDTSAGIWMSSRILRRRLADGLKRPRLICAWVAALAFGVALLRPGITLNADINSTLLVVDITQSMNAADMPAGNSPGQLAGSARPITRLAYTRKLLQRVVQEMPCGNRLGVGIFTERKTLALIGPVEVCAHGAALHEVLDRLDWRMAWAADSHLYYGTYSALDTLADQWPGTALALFTDGHQAPALPPDAEPRFERGPNTPAGWLFGVGGLQPTPVPRTNAEGKITGYWTAEDAAAFASGGRQPTLSVLDMERMARGEDLRNRSQRAPGTDGEHLSARHDEVLDKLGQITGLQVQVADSSSTVVRALRALPGGTAEPQRREIHAPLVALGALAMLVGLLPLPRRKPSSALTPAAAHPP